MLEKCFPSFTTEEIAPRTFAGSYIGEKNKPLAFFKDVGIEVKSYGSWWFYDI